MKPAPRAFDLLTKEQRERLSKETIAFFEKERGEEIGMIAAGEMIDFFLDALGPAVYNKAVSDAKVVIRQGFDSTELDVDALTKK